MLTRLENLLGLFSFTVSSYSADCQSLPTAAASDWKDVSPFAKHTRLLASPFFFLSSREKSSKTNKKKISFCCFLHKIQTLDAGGDTELMDVGFSNPTCPPPFSASRRRWKAEQASSIHFHQHWTNCVWKDVIRLCRAVVSSATWSLQQPSDGRICGSD